MPGCDGIGFGFDLLPTDPDYQDEHGGWIHDEDESDDAEHGSNGFADHGGDPPYPLGGDEEMPF